MLINAQNIAGLFTGFKTSFNKGFEGAESHYKKVAMVVPSTSKENNYTWMGQFPKFREWVGDRVLNNLAAHSYILKNKTFESTITVPREDIEDDQYGIFGPMFEEQGRLAKEHPDELVFSMLKKGFTEKCYDGQFFFDTDHKVLDAQGVEQSVSNFGGGAGRPWFLMDCSRAVKSIVFQERRPYKFAALDAENDLNVFMRKEYIYGVDARVNAGFGLWQLAYASKEALEYDSFTAARAALRGLKGDGERPLGIKPTHLIVHPEDEEAALAILKGDTRLVETEEGVTNVSNPWRGTTELIVSEWL